MATIDMVDLKKVAYWKPGSTSFTVMYDRDNGGNQTGFTTFTEETSPTSGQTFSDFNFVVDAVNFPQWVDDVVSYRVDAIIEATYKDSSKRSFEISYSFEEFDLSNEFSESIYGSGVKAGQAAMRAKILLMKQKTTEVEVELEASASTSSISMIVAFVCVVFALLF